MGRAHLVGIAGAGMRSLAAVLVGRGWQVSGSDLDIRGVLGLAAAGVRLMPGHAAAHLPTEAELVIYSDAVGPDNAELCRAAELGIPKYRYFEMVGRLTSDDQVLAVAGTHGKSTTAAMAGHVLEQAGSDPTVLCGATPLAGISGGRAGHGDLAVVEACEYRRNFLHLRPRQAVILGIEPDHFDCFATREELEDAFAQFARLVPLDGLTLARHDCEATARATAGLRCRVEQFGIEAQVAWSARNLRPRQGRYEFDVCRYGRHLCHVSLQVPGRHNVLNALAASALCWENGVASHRIAAALARFRGLHRRFELLGTWRGVALVDDYAHHPTEVAAALETARQAFPGRRLWCVFQPHQASRTAHLLDELAESLQNADKVLVAEIFRAREAAARPGEVTAADLAHRVRQRACENTGTGSLELCRKPGAGQPGEVPVPVFSQAPSGADVLACHRIEEIVARLRDELAPGDVLMTLGAGDIWRTHQQLRYGQAARHAA